MILTLKIGHCKWRVTWNNNDISLISQTIPLVHGFYETLWLALNCNQFIHLLLHTAYLTVLGNKIWAFFFLFLFTMFIKLFSSLMINRTFAKVPGVSCRIKKNWRKKNNRIFFSLCYPPDTKKILVDIKSIYMAMEFSLNFWTCRFKTRGIPLLQTSGSVRTLVLMTKFRL